MDNLVLAATTQTPDINFDVLTGVMQIEGRCIPDAPDGVGFPI